MQLLIIAYPVQIVITEAYLCDFSDVKVTSKIATAGLRCLVFNKLGVNKLLGQHMQAGLFSLQTMLGVSQCSW